MVFVRYLSETETILKYIYLTRSYIWKHVPKKVSRTKTLSGCNDTHSHLLKDLTVSL